MMKKLLFVICASAIILISACNSTDTATDTANTDKKPATKVTDTTDRDSKTSKPQVIRADFAANLASYFPDVKPDNVRLTPIDGIYEVLVDAQLFYFSDDARYLIDGKMIDLKTKTNLTTPSLNNARLNLSKVISEDNMIVFSPENPKYTVTVFTDIDCGYCRKMHSQIEEYNKLGIAIRYLFFPRAGFNSGSYWKAVSVWCSDDQKKALTDSKKGKQLDKKSCKNPVEEHLKLVKRLDISGTPAILFSKGQLIMSYIPPAELLKLLQRIN